MRVLALGKLRLFTIAETVPWPCYTTALNQRFEQSVMHFYIHIFLAFPQLITLQSGEILQYQYPSVY